MAATSGLFGSLEDLNGKIPLFIKLRSLDIRSLKISSLIEFLAPTLADYIPEGWVAYCLANQKFVFLIDGIDELPAEQRNGVREWIKEMTSDHPDHVYLVTSRPSAVSDRWLDKQGFSNVNLRPMTEAKIVQFVQKWHDTIGSAMPVSGRADIEHYKRNVLSIVNGSREIRSIASYPLLAAILCCMNYQLSGQMPRNRMEFFQAGINALLERRDATRSPILGKLGNATLAQKYLIVQAIAFWFLQNRVSEVSKDSVKGCIRRVLPYLKKVDLNVDDVYTYLVERSGIIREPQMGMVSFIHNSFKEFLAAREYIQQDHVNYLASHAKEADFRETFIMAVGHSLAGQRESILRKLMEMADSAREERRPLLLVLSACLEVCDRLSPAVSRSILDKVKSICPPRTMFEAKDLSYAVELKPAIMKGFGSEHSEYYSSIILSLCLSGRSEALELVEYYSDAGGRNMAPSLITGIENFDANIYGALIFPRMRFEGRIIVDGSVMQFLSQDGAINLSVRIGGLSSLDILRGMKGLKEIEIRGHAELSDASALETCQNLEKIILHFCPKLTNIGRIVEINSLKLLDVRNCDSVDDSFVSYRRDPCSDTLDIWAFSTTTLAKKNTNDNVRVHEFFFG